MGALAVLDNFGEIDRRRASLETGRNPKTRLDYTIGLERNLSIIGMAGPVRLIVRYIPDAFILNGESFDDYCALLLARKWASLEDLAGTIIDDFNNELIPRWIEITLKTSLPGNKTGYQVIMEDRQPAWSRQTPLSN